MMPRTWPAPAKLNLFLHITGRREDGYHSLQSVFQFLDFRDEVRVEVRDDGEIRRHGEIPGVPPEQDLMVRAARLLQDRCEVSRGADLSLVKNLPMGGGLGGGSSDAATTLVALNQLWRLGLPTEALADFGLELGADVPVFVYGQAAWAEGVGESLTPVSPAEPWYLVVHPGCHVSTREVFSSPELTRNTSPIKIPPLLLGESCGDADCWIRDLMDLTANDCESLVRQLYPEVDEALRWLGELAPARMTGTGACIFAPFHHEGEARSALGRLPRGWRGFVARGLNCSPLHAMIAGVEGMDSPE